MPGDEEPRAMLALRPKAVSDGGWWKSFAWFSERIRVSYIIMDCCLEFPARWIGNRALLHCSNSTSVPDKCLIASGKFPDVAASSSHLITSCLGDIIHLNERLSQRGS